jgi:aspartate/methionine/tyrosine aminotransferase
MVEFSAFVRGAGRAGTTAAAEAARARHESGGRVLDLRGDGIFNGRLPDHIVEEAKRAAWDSKSPPSNGLPELREAIAIKLRNENGIDADPATEILVTTGAKEAIFITMAALLTPGDEVLLHTPNYVFNGAIRLHGGVPVYLPTQAADGFRLHLQQAEASVSARTRLLILCNPVNPTGHLPSRSEVEAFGSFVTRHKLMVLADESYEKYVYDGHAVCSLASYQEFRKQVITVQSFSKSYSLADYRVGYMVGPSQFISTCRCVLEWIDIYLNPVSQSAAWASLTGPQAWVSDMIRDYQTARDHFLAVITQVPRLPCACPQATGMAFVNIAAYNMPSSEVSRLLLERYGVPSVPGSVFNGEGYIRLPFGCSDAIHTELIYALKHSLLSCS